MQTNLSRADLATKILHREPQPVYGPEATELVKGKRVLVTGAGGSIGSEIVRQVRRLGAAEVFCVDVDEYALYTLQLDLTGTALLDDPHFILADVRSLAQIERAMNAADPHIVFHAAAHKHLPLLERAPHAAITTNAEGTFNVVSTAIGQGVERLINISTDKAATPTSILGMSKRLAEMMVARQARNGMTKLASVRFGNVLGSRGSFLETLEHQISHSLPIQLTALDVERYFMTIPEAAGLVIEAAVLADKAETLVLDMGEPIKITEIVKRFCDLTGHALPFWEISGLRQGEKITEELFDNSEVAEATTHSRITKVSVDAPADHHSWRTLFNRARSLSYSHDYPQYLADSLRAVIAPAPSPFTVVGEFTVSLEA
jgi:FlaA1/EpsC-like NDP-sugar epimerase